MGYLAHFCAIGSYGYVRFGTLHWQESGFFCFIAQHRAEEKEQRLAADLPFLIVSNGFVIHYTSGFF
jgi:hypothetical protein